MVGPRLDPSLWNLSVPVALLAACGPMIACGPIVAVGETDTGSASADSNDTSDSSVVSVTSPSTTSPMTSPSTTTPTGCVVDEDCPPNYRCDNGTCYYNGYCDDDYCCYDKCCGAECGWYNECYYSSDCPPGYACQYNNCYALTAEAICESVPFGIGFEIPIGTGVNSLAFIESDGNAERELLIGGSGLTLARIDGTTALIDPDPYVLDIEVRDLDGDGDQDIVTANANTSAPRVLFAGNGWTGEDVPGAALTDAVSVVDLAGDGLPEIVGASAADNSFVYQYGGSPGAWEASYAWNPSYFVTSGPLDGDPFEDLLYSGYGVYATYGGFSFNSIQLYNGVGQGLQRGVIGSFDGQGDRDVILTESGNGTVVSMWPGSVLQGNGWWSTWWPTNVDVSVVADINADGFDDVVGGSGSGLTIAYGGAEPDGIVCVSSVPTPYGVYVLAVGDMSGDGRLDIAISDGAVAYVMLRTD